MKARCSECGRQLEPATAAWLDPSGKVVRRRAGWHGCPDCPTGEVLEEPEAQKARTLEDLFPAPLVDFRRDEH